MFKLTLTVCWLVASTTGEATTNCTEIAKEVPTMLDCSKMAVMYDSGIYSTGGLKVKKYICEKKDETVNR